MKYECFHLFPFLLIWLKFGNLADTFYNVFSNILTSIML